MIKNFEEFTKIQSFGDGFSQWKKGYLNHSAIRCVDDTLITRALVRSAFKANPKDYGQVFTKDDAKYLGLNY